MQTHIDSYNNTWKQHFFVKVLQVQPVIFLNTPPKFNRWNLKITCLEKEKKLLRQSTSIFGGEVYANSPTPSNFQSGSIGLLTSQESAKNREGNLEGNLRETWKIQCRDRKRMFKIARKLVDFMYLLDVKSSQSVFL